MPCCIILSTISAVRVLYFLCVRVVSVVLYFTLHHALPKSTAQLSLPWKTQHSASLMKWG